MKATYPALPVALLALAAIPPQAGAAESLERLFFSPQQRAALEQRRHASEDLQMLGTATLRLDGIALRSNGKASAWINGAPQHEGSGDFNFTLPAGQAGSAQLSRGAEKFGTLRVGEITDRMSGTRSDLVMPGSVSMRNGREEQR